MIGADLGGTNLRGSDLSSASLIDSVFVDANLSEAILNGANLGEAKMNGADLSKAKLRNAIINHAELSAAKLVDADMVGANLSEARLLKADLTRSKMMNADLTSANLKEATLHNAVLEGARLNEAILVSADLSGAKLVSSVLASADLRRANLQDATFKAADLHDCKMQEASLRRTDLTEVKNLLVTQLAGADLTAAILPNVVIQDRIECAVRSASHARKIFTPVILTAFVLMLVAILVHVRILTDIKIPPLGISVDPKHFTLGMSAFLLIIYAYFLHYMGRLWENLADLPAWFCDGAPIYRYPDPWFPINFLRRYLWRLKGQSANHRAVFAFIIVWVLVPFAMALSTISFWIMNGYAWALAVNMTVLVFTCGLVYVNHFEAKAALVHFGSQINQPKIKLAWWGAISFLIGVGVYLILKSLDAEYADSDAFNLLPY